MSAETETDRPSSLIDSEPGAGAGDAPTTIDITEGSSEAVEAAPSSRASAVSISLASTPLVSGITSAASFGALEAALEPTTKWQMVRLAKPTTKQIDACVACTCNGLFVF